MGLLIITLTSCVGQLPRAARYPNAPTVNKIVLIDDTFSKDEYDHIVEALHDWENASGGLLNFAYARMHTSKEKMVLLDKQANAVVIEKVLKDDERIIAIDLSLASGLQTLGVYFNNPMTTPEILIVNDRLPFYNEFKAVVEHEVEHFLLYDYLAPGGDQHPIKKGALLAANRANGSDYITKADLELFCKYYQCKVE